MGQLLEGARDGEPEAVGDLVLLEGDVARYFGDEVVDALVNAAAVHHEAVALHERLACEKLGDVEVCLFFEFSRGCCLRRFAYFGMAFGKSPVAAVLVLDEKYLPAAVFFL